MLILETELEKQFVTEKFGDQSFWIGASELDKEGEWRWIDGSPVDMSLFGQGEPNDREGREERCAAIMVLHEKTQKFMSDFVCSEKSARVCEFKKCFIAE